MEDKQIYTSKEVSGVVARAYNLGMAVAFRNRSESAFETYEYIREHFEASTPENLRVLLQPHLNSIEEKFKQG